MRLQRILVPVDFSAHAEQAAIIALQLANRHSAEVTLLHVDPFPGAAVVAVEPVYIPPDLFDGLHADYNRRIDAKMSRLQDLLAPHRTGAAAIRTERHTADVHEGIIEQATEGRADLIVMGSSGLSGAARLILGSVADKVSRSAPCPVLITRANHDDARPPKPFRKVLVGVDYSPFSAPVARLAATVTAADGAIELIHVWNPPYISVLDTHLGGADSGPLSRGLGLASAAEADKLQEFVSEIDLAGASCFVAAGSSVANAILDRCDEIEADLIVLGAHGRRDLGERLLGTTADRILRHAEVAVLLMPEAALPG